MKRFSVLILLFGFYFILNGQQSFRNRNDLYPPLDGSLNITGYYGDVRSATFHFGIDYSTMGKCGLPVYAIDSGYVARIKIEAGGYGRAIYINHSNGVTSVYAHLDSFSSKLSKYVRKIQYETQSFAQDLLLDSLRFWVKKGEVIGYSGNSGQSTGPHLHFELRKTSDQRTIHPMIRVFHSSDTISPAIDKFLLYPSFPFLSKNPLPALTIPVSAAKQRIYLLNNLKVREYILSDTIFRVPQQFFIGISAHDFLVPNGKKVSFYATKLYVDSYQVFEICFDELPFTEVGQVNGIIDFQRRKLQGDIVYFLYQYPQFSITPIKKTRNNGLIVLNDTLLHTVKIEVYDLAGNLCRLQFKVKQNNVAKTNNTPLPPSVIQAGSLQVIKRDGAQVIFSPNSLFANTNIPIKKIYQKSVINGYILEVGEESIPLKSSITLEFTLDNIPQKWHSKLRVIRMDGNKFESIGGDVEKFHISARTKKLGRFALAIDTIPPQVRFLNLKENVRPNGSIKVHVSDNLAGIKSWAGYIDGRWVLFEYDLKNNELRYIFDENCPYTNQLHSLELRVEDYCGNKTVRTIQFLY